MYKFAGTCSEISKKISAVPKYLKFKSHETVFLEQKIYYVFLLSFVTFLITGKYLGIEESQYA